MKRDPQIGERNRAWDTRNPCPHPGHSTTLAFLPSIKHKGSYYLCFFHPGRTERHPLFHGMTRVTATQSCFV